MTDTMLSKADAIEAAMKIDGWLTEREAGALYDLAKNATGPIIEIGSWRGRSTAALAHGSMAGNGHPVFAVDSFVGVSLVDRPTAQGNRPGPASSSPEILRANLDAAGVNGLVKIIPAPSNVVAEHLPECAVLFVDGAHDYQSVCTDFDLYLPKVVDGGTVMVHDCWELDPDVPRAVDDKLMCKPESWRMRGRVDSAIIAERRATQRHTVCLAAPAGSFLWGAARGMMTATLGAHQVTVINSQTGWDDMANLWAQGLNAAFNGVATHFAMLHSDVVPDPGWIDTLLTEMDERDADLVSVAVPIKDKRGLVSCGLGEASNPWAAFRRFTMHELMQMPATFGIEDTPHPDKYLLHNTGCWVADLRKPLWRQTDSDGCLRAYFNFPLRGRIDEKGQVIHERESEDWHFSRKIAELGAKTFITRKVAVDHLGNMEFSNASAWGMYEHDEETKDKWDSGARSDA